MRMERQKAAAEYRAQGEGQASQIRSEADAMWDSMVTKANAEAEEVRAAGDAEAAEYYKKFRQNPELAIFIAKVKALKEITKERTTIIIDKNTPPFDLLDSDFFTHLF